MAEKYYLTTPIYYVNARPHIGHAYTTIVADVLARRHRLLGEDVFFLTGTDEHGQKIERSAAAAGIPPQQFADQVSESFRALWQRMGITNDDFIRTTEPRHHHAVQRLFANLQASGHIYLDSYTGAYCVSDETFVDVAAGTPCPDCGRVTETVTEENYFFRLSRFQEQLIQLIERGELAIEPEARRNEVLSFVRGGLRDLSISRSSFTWGIPVPRDPKHVIYVWLDALTNYMTAVGYGDDSAEAQAMFARYWPADLHIVGKEIIRFHCVYWPAFLLAASLPLPKKIVAHGWLLFDDSKMSKSKGNIVRTETILDGFGELCPGSPSKAEQDLFGADVLRYFLLREIPFGQDGSFSFEALIKRYNADLGNTYGNLLNRTVTMVEKYSDGVVPPIPRYLSLPSWARLNDLPDAKDYVVNLPPNTDNLWLAIIDAQGRIFTGLDHDLKVFGGQKAFETNEDPTFSDIIRVSAILSNFVALKTFEKSDYSRSLQSIMAILQNANNLISKVQPWKLDFEIDEQKKKAMNSLYDSLESLRFATALLYPYLPYATANAWRQLGLGEIEEAAKNGELKDLTWGGLKPGTKLGPLSPIFPRADKGLAQIMADMEQTPKLENITAQEDASSAAKDDLPTGPIASATSQESAPKSKLVDESFVTSPTPLETSHPGAPPRTGSFTEPNPGLQVAGSTAETTERPGTPSHAEAPASGIFAHQQPADTSPQITIDDFAKVELRVAKIVVAERIPKADKLLRLEVDLGYERRQILSGIAEWYTPEDLLGRRIVVITNLAPRKMRGLESHGMLLAASGPDGGKPVLATFDPAEELPLGSRLK